MARLHPSEFIHPEDEAARRQLEAIPGFSGALKLILQVGLEQYFHPQRGNIQIGVGKYDFMMV